MNVIALFRLREIYKFGFRCREAPAKGFSSVLPPSLPPYPAFCFFLSLSFSVFSSFSVSSLFPSLSLVLHLIFPYFVFFSCSISFCTFFFISTPPPPPLTTPMHSFSLLFPSVFVHLLSYLFSLQLLSPSSFYFKFSLNPLLSRNFFPCFTSGFLFFSFFRLFFLSPL